MEKGVPSYTSPAQVWNKGTKIGFFNRRGSHAFQVPHGDDKRVTIKSTVKGNPPGFEELLMFQRSLPNHYDVECLDGTVTLVRRRIPVRVLQSNQEFDQVAEEFWAIRNRLKSVM